MAQMFDAAVLGGGPAGATTAICLARRGWKVCLFEGAPPADPCGETLPPEVSPLLRDLGIFEEFRSLGPLETPGIVSVWGGPQPYAQDFIHRPHGPGWHVDRGRFDEMLRRLAAEAGVTRRRIRADVSSIRAGLIVDAAGRNGLRAGGACARDVDDRLIAIVLRGAGAPADHRTYIEAIPAGWWYSAPLSQDEIVAMFFTDPGIYRHEGIVLEEQLRQAPFTRARLREVSIRGSRTVAVSSSCRKTIAGEGWLSVGDSASSYDPLSGRGVFKALRHGQMAACMEPQKYAAAVRAEYESYVRQRRRYYAMESRWANQPFWRRRARHELE